MKRAKKLGCLILASLLIWVSFSVYVSAAPLSPPGSVYQVRDGKTYLGTFKTSQLSDSHVAFLNEFSKSSKNVLFTRTWKGFFYVYFAILDGIGSVSYQTIDGYGSLRIKVNEPIARYIYFTVEGDELVPYPHVSHFARNSYQNMYGILSGTFLDTLDLSRFPNKDFITPVSGPLILEDDSGLFNSIGLWPEPGTQPEPSEPEPPEPELPEPEPPEPELPSGPEPSEPSEPEFPPLPPMEPEQYQFLDYSMFAPMFNYLRDNGGVVITFFIKAFLMVTGATCLIGLVRYIILSAVGNRDNDAGIR